MDAHRQQRFVTDPECHRAAANANFPDLDGDTAPDHSRAIIHFDVDCFYAQAEEVRNPSLRGRPLGVTQKYLIVTCNYEARRRGVTKLMGIQDARAKCHDLVLVRNRPCKRAL
jgi:DNA polymerase iota